MEENILTIFERIHASYYQLTAAERRVADCVLARHSEIQSMSITQLAETCGVAEATISRFCRSLQLKGYNAFKLELAKSSVNPTPQNQPTRQHDPATFAGRCWESVHLAEEAITQTMEVLNQQMVENVISLFEHARHIMCMGSGSSMIMAQECVSLFSRVSPKFFSLPDSHQQLSMTAAMGEQDAIVLFSYSGATRSGLEVMEFAKSRGIPTVLITRYPTSPIAKIADYVLRCGSNEGPFQLGSVPARIAQLALLDVLFREYQHRNKDACSETLRLVGSALSVEHI